MSIAYIVLAHRLPQQLARLIERLDDGQARFFVHLDSVAHQRHGAGADLQEQFLRAAGQRSNICLLPRYRCYWGSFEIVRATLAGIHAVVDSGVPFERVMLLSGQHYPIKPVAHIHRFLAQRRDAEFMESFPLRSPNRWTRQRGPFRDVARVLHRHFRFRSRWLHLPLRRRFPAGLQPYGGSQWWCLSLPCVTYIADFTRSHPQVVDYFKRCFIPDESFFQTLVSNSPFHERLVASDLTYVKWNEPTPPYPAILDRRCIDALQSSAALFARKFDQTQDEEILDLIDRRILTDTRSPARAGSAAAMRGAALALPQSG